MSALVAETVAETMAIWSEPGREHRSSGAASLVTAALLLVV
jgi:hypothetical protein